MQQYTFNISQGYFALAELGRLQPYQTLLITAASSSTGMAAIAMAKKMGATIIATTRTSKKRDVKNIGVAESRG